MLNPCRYKENPYVPEADFGNMHNSLILNDLQRAAGALDVTR